MVLLILVIVIIGWIIGCLLQNIVIELRYSNILKEQSNKHHHE